MQNRTLRMTYDDKPKIEVWVDCQTVEDCEVLILWLQLAKANLRQWEKINAKASRSKKAEAEGMK